MKIPVYNQKGEKIKDADVKSEIFNVEENSSMLREVVLSFLSAARNSKAKVKTRAEVSGGGKKPWRQKGTGRARTGSIRNPIWRGGGIIFGPTGNENHIKKVNRKAKNQALHMALAGKKGANEIIVIEKLDIKKPNTKEMAKILEKMPDAKNRLIVLPEKNESIEKSLRNIPQVVLKGFNYLNVFEVLKANQIIFVGDALQKSLDHFSGITNVKAGQTSEDK